MPQQRLIASQELSDWQQSSNLCETLTSIEPKLTPKFPASVVVTALVYNLPGSHQIQ
jgi:hypothetical protein